MSGNETNTLIENSLSILTCEEKGLGFYSLWHSNASSEYPGQENDLLLSMLLTTRS